MDTLKPKNSRAGTATRPYKVSRLTRRGALAQFWGLVAGSPLIAAQSAARAPHLPDRIPPLDQLINADEMERAARASLPKALYDHIAAGAGGEGTLRRNRAFFERITIHPRVLTDVSQMDLTSELFGETMFAPILAGPTAQQGRLHPEGELATVRGAAAAKAKVVVSHRASRPLDEVLPQGNPAPWFQVHAGREDAVIRDEVQKAVGLGSKVVFLTAGSPYHAVLARDVHNAKLSAGTGESRGGTSSWPPSPGSPLARGSASDGWGLLGKVKEWAGVPVVLKGVLSPAEARETVDHGAAGIVVSNHGGRVLDGVRASIEALPAVIEAVDGRLPVLVDSGFRRGTDIFKALALGAQAVLLGRPVLWALAAYGEQGVKFLLEMLQTELALAMGLAGQPNLASLSPELVRIHRW